MIVSRAPRTSIYTKIRRNRNLRALPLERVAQQDTAVAAILHCPTWDEELHGAPTTTSRTARCPFPYHIQGPKCSAALVSISNDWQHCATQTPVRSAPVRPYSAALVSRKKTTTCDTVQHKPRYTLPHFVHTQPPLWQKKNQRLATLCSTTPIRSDNDDDDDDDDDFFCASDVVGDWKQWCCDSRVGSDPLPEPDGVGRTARPLSAGLWDGARGFPPDPTPQTACSVIGTAPRVFVRRIVTLIGVFSMVLLLAKRQVLEQRAYSQEQAPCR